MKGDLSMGDKIIAGSVHDIVFIIEKQLFVPIMTVTQDVKRQQKMDVGCVFSTIISSKL
jgi:hypothetical protein